MPTLAVFGAHAMDAEVMGGAIARDLSLKNWDTWLIHMTRGERGKGPHKSIEYAKQLEAEMENSAAKLKSKCIWMGYKAGEIPEGEAGIMDIGNVLKKVKPDVVITHWKGSYHPRHVQTHESVINGLKYMADNFKMEASLYFGENLEDLEGFHPTAYYDISESYSAWVEALNCYEMFRESVKFPYRDFYSSNSISRGVESGFKYSKALMLPRVKIADLRQDWSLCAPRY